jgi:hypothetical protein
MPRLPDILDRYRIGGEIYKCPKCGLLIEIDEEGLHKNAIGFEINGVIHAIALKDTFGRASLRRKGVPVIDTSKLPTHPDCIWMLIPARIKEEGRKWE